MKFPNRTFCFQCEIMLIVLQDTSYVFILDTVDDGFGDCPYSFRDLLDITTRINYSPVFGVSRILS